MGKASRKAQVSKQTQQAVEPEEEQGSDELKSWGSFDAKEKAWFTIKWGYVVLFWVYFYSWAGSHSGKIDDGQVRYYLWFFDQAKTIGGAAFAILTIMESQTLLSGRKGK